MPRIMSASIAICVLFVVAEEIPLPDNFDRARRLASSWMDRDCQRHLPHLSNAGMFNRGTLGAGSGTIRDLS
jgi:hypothetical protein